MPTLNKNQINQFVEDGFVKLDNAVPADLCSQIREILWKDMDVVKDDPSTWTKSVIRLGFYKQDPFNKAINMPALTSAYNQLAGTNKWIPPKSMGTFPVRFPSIEEPRDTGWHVDSSFAGSDLYDYSRWRINVFSKGRALLMLFVFSDTGENDAPTVIKKGSHLDVARILEPYGEEGLTFTELTGRLNISMHRPGVSATGESGTVFLCHPFIVHAAQTHHGTSPRFLAQPALELREPLLLSESSETPPPIEKAILMALGR